MYLACALPTPQKRARNPQLWRPGHINRTHFTEAVTAPLVIHHSQVGLAALVDSSSLGRLGLRAATMTDLSLSRSQMLLLSGSANRPLATEVAAHLGQPLCQVTLRRFADGEIFVKIDENVSGRDVYIIQPTNPPAENMMELLLLMDAAKRASAARVTSVIPYFGYARQDRKDQPRVAISAKLMANMVSMAGADRVLAIDFHQHQLQGFFDLPVDHLYAAPVFVSHFRQKQLHDPVVVAPDVGSAKMARGLAKRLNASLAVIYKRRPSANVAEVLNVVGEVGDRDCLIPDDMIDTAGTMA